MNTNYSENNNLVLIGNIVSEKNYSHEIYGEKFYIFNLEVKRLSSTSDIIPITISERLITNFDLKIGKQIEIEGQFRSYNNYESERNRLVLTVFAKEIKEVAKTARDDLEKKLGEKVISKKNVLNYKYMEQKVLEEST